MIKIRSIFPNNENEKDLVRFLGRYQYISSSDVKYFFDDNSYYKKRMTKLVENNILKRQKKYLVIAEQGYNYLKLLNEPITKLNHNERYVKRLKSISHIAAVYLKEKNVIFQPSFEVKIKDQYTESSRKYIGTLNIDGIKHLVYYISKENDARYIKSITYDIQKESKYKNIVVLVDSVERINLNDFFFGLNTVIICENDDETLQKLKYLYKVNWYKVMQELYNHSIRLSEYKFCDYIDKENKYITYFNFIDTEKINRIATFIRNNPGKIVDIVCTEELKEILNKELPTINYKCIDINKFIEKEFKIYE